MANISVTSKLVVPLAIWGQQPPTHCISCLEMSPDQSVLATGSNDGQICLWYVDTDMTLQPRTMLFGHAAAITCMTMTSYDNHTSHLISASDNGEISLWDCKDGQCLESKKTTYTHMSMKSHLMLNTREPRIICNGTYAEIQIIDALSLRVLIRLTARIQSNWISALCILRPVKQEADVIVAMSNSGTVKVWALSSEHSSDLINSSICEDESKQLRCLGAQTLTCCPYNQRTVLIVCSKYWQMYVTNYVYQKQSGLHNERHIYDAGDFSLLCSESCRRGNRWLGGDFIAIDRVIVFSNEGRAYLYQLPTNITSDVDTSSPPPPPGNPRLASQAGPQVYMMLDVNVELSLERLRCTPVMRYFLGTRDKQTQLCIRGDSQGRVTIWQIPKVEKKTIKLARQESVDGLPAISPLHCCKLQDSWQSCYQSAKVEGFFDYLNKSTTDNPITDNKEKSKKVTSSIFIEAYGKLVCGRSDGSVVTVDALDCIMAKLFGRDKDMLQLSMIQAHTGAVTCLLHPYSTTNDPKRYPKDLLVTGGADFTVCLWSLESYQRLFTFSVHGGEITQLITPPYDCNSRILSTICSVAADHSVALLNVIEYKCCLFASRHLFSVETIKWRPAFDFLVVLCTDGTVYVWQMETGHLDRVAHGVIGKEIIAECNTTTYNDNSSTSATDSKENADMAMEEEPSEISISQAFRRRNIATFRNLAQQHLKRSSVNEQSDNQNRANLPHPSIEQNIGQSPMCIQALETNFSDPLAHIVYFDIEALIVQLLNDEYLKMKPAELAGYGLMDSDEDHKSTTRRMSPTPTGELATPSYVMKVARLVTSVLHAWGLDASLDRICSRRLGLIKPCVDVSFGVLSKSGHMSFLLPGWSKQKDYESKQTTENYSRHWQISESLTTRHLLSVIALSNTLMGMSTATFLPSVDDSALLDDDQPRYTGDVPSDNSETSVNQAQTKQGWSMLAALHCVLLPDIIGGQDYAPPQIEILVRRWQDRCLEIREASQALLMAELRRIGPEGRNKLAELWITRMPGDGSNGSETLSSIIGADPLRPPPVATSLTAVVAKDMDEDDCNEIEDFEDLMLGSCKSITSSLSSEARRRQATAIVLMSVLGAEFGDTITPVDVTEMRNRAVSLAGFGVNDYSSARLTSNALSFLLLQPISICLPAHTALRRAAVDLIGRGFTVWEPYLDVSAVLMAILRLCTDADTLVPALPYSLPLCAKADCCRSARHALSLVATSRPLAFITAMAKEVARHNARLSGQSSGHSSSGHSLATLTTNSTLHTPLVKSKSEILRIIELLIEKIPNEICDLMMEVMDITLHCVDSNLAKVHGLKEIFPPIFKFSNVAYCPDTKKACVGARNGGVAFYDLKHTKTQIMQLAGHKGPVSAVAFSPQGRYATSYSLADDKLLFWQMASTSLFGIGSQPTKCVRSYSTPKMDFPMSTSRVRRVRLVWIDANTCVLLAADGSEARYRI